jgi:hypothetical protein
MKRSHLTFRIQSHFQDTISRSGYISSPSHGILGRSRNGIWTILVACVCVVMGLGGCHTAILGFFVERG